MKTIPLTKGYVALVDDDDADRVLVYKWRVLEVPNSTQRYAHRSRQRLVPDNQPLFLHRFVMQAKHGTKIDHRDGVGLNCQKTNLRQATSSQNRHNSKVMRGNQCGLKGVKRDKRCSKSWTAQITIKGKLRHLGTFRTPKEAAHAYDTAARQEFGEFACVNFPVGNERPAITTQKENPENG